MEPPRNPAVGDPPWIHARSPGVEKPSPSSLSKNAQRNVKPSRIRTIPRAVKPQRAGVASTAACVAAVAVVEEVGTDEAVMVGSG